MIALISGVMIVFFLVIAFFFKIFLYLLFSVIFMYLINPIVKKVQEKGYSKSVALVIVFIGIVTILLAGFYLFFPVIIDELNALNSELPKISDRLDFAFVEEVEKSDGSTSYVIPQLWLEISSEDIGAWKDRIYNYLRSLISISLDVLFAALIIIPIITTILVKDGEKIKRNFFRLVPNKYFEVTVSIIDGINRTLSNFIYAKFIQTLIISILCSVGFLFIGLKAGILFGIMVGILNIIPYIGPIISLVPVGAVGFLFNDTKTALFAMAIIGLAQLIDNIIIQPVILPKLLNNHPLTVIILTLIGAKLMGPVGMIIAIPVFSVFKEVFIRVYKGLVVLYSRDYECI